MQIIDFFQQHFIQYLIYIGFIGLCVGSFLNVVIYRFPIMLQREWQAQCSDYLKLESTSTLNHPEIFNLIVPRSRCPHCQHLISALENIPFISYLILKGKCAHCKQPISLRYPLIEATSAALSVFIAWFLGVSFATLAALIFTWFLLCLTFIDIDHQILPDDMTQPLIWLGLFFSLFDVFTNPQNAIIGALTGYLILWTIAWIFQKITKRGGMGHGDFKLLAALGAWLGWQLLPSIILFSSLVGATVGITFIFTKKQDRHTPIPFGPYLAAAGWLALFWGNSVTHLYLNLFSN